MQRVRRRAARLRTTDHEDRQSEGKDAKGKWKTTGEKEKEEKEKKENEEEGRSPGPLLSHASKQAPGAPARPRSFSACDQLHPAVLRGWFASTTISMSSGQFIAYSEPSARVTADF